MNALNYLWILKIFLIISTKTVRKYENFKICYDTIKTRQGIKSSEFRTVELKLKAFEIF